MNEPTTPPNTIGMNSKELFQHARDAHSSRDYKIAAQLYKRVISEFPSSDEAALAQENLNNIRGGIRNDSQSSEVAHSNNVVITDIRMPFLSMVVFMVKWVVATIPAIIILFIIALVFGAMFGGILGGIYK